MNEGSEACRRPCSVAIIPTRVAQRRGLHLSDAGRQIYRHDPVGQGTVPFADVPRALAAAGYTARPMLEIISRDPDGDIVASAVRLASLGFTPANSNRMHEALSQS